MSFKTEEALFKKALSSSFIENLINNNKYQSHSLIEPKGLFGIPDLIIANIKFSRSNICKFKAYAFEMKLSNWKRALAQAFRYKAFANFSFVIIDRRYSKAAVSHLNEFIRANVGLFSIDESGLFYDYYYPNFDIPYSERLALNLKEMVLKRYYSNIL